MRRCYISSDIWLDPVFKGLSQNARAVLLFAMTSPYGNSCQLYRVGPDAIALACRIPEDAARDALAELCDVGALAYDFTHELVWLETQMRAELGDALKPGDKRIPYLKRLVGELPDCEIRAAMIGRYSVAYHLDTKAPSKAPSEAPYEGDPNPLASQYKTKQGQDNEDHAKGSDHGYRSGIDRLRPPVAAR